MALWCSDESVLQREALAFFKSLFQSNGQCNPQSLHLQNIPKMSSNLYDLLLQPVSREEIKVALFSMHSYKAPRPDGFQPVFFKAYWNIIEDDVYDLVSKTFVSGSIDPHLAETLIVPIPKVDDPTSLKDFRPVSLCNMMLKLISKILVKRIRPYLDEFIRPLQSSFIPNSGTSDNTLIAQEIVHFMHRKKGKGGHLMFKIDFEKAYDKVDWNFLRMTLHEL